MTPDNYDARCRARLAQRLAAADKADFSAQHNHLITVLVYPEKPGDERAVEATLASLRAQRYRNIEVLVTAGFGGVAGPEQVDHAGFTTLRGLFIEPSLDPGAILADPAHDPLWRGSHIAFAPTGTRFAEDAFLLFNASLRPPEGRPAPDLVLCDHDRIDANGRHCDPGLLPGWVPDLLRESDYLGNAFVAARSLVDACRGGPAPASLHGWLCRVAGGRVAPVTRHIAEPLLHLPREAPVARIEPGDRPAQTGDAAAQKGLCLLGHLLSQDGLGQAARLIARACDTSRLPMSFYHLPIPERDAETEFATKCTRKLDRQATLLVAALAALPSLRGLRPDRHNILYPYWELPKVPAEWLQIVEQFDEIWAATTFIVGMFEQASTKPVTLVPQPLNLPAAVPAPRPKPQTLRLFTFFDFDSTGNRKNPEAAINAFRAAFPPRQRDVVMVVKAHGTRDGGLRQWLAEAAAKDRRITVIDRTLPRAEMDALMTGCDTYISLHRAEGFGFGAAEALAAGKAVVATDYSGTADFITPETGYPVAYDLVPIPRGAFIHTDGQVWAEPDLEAAAVALRAVYDDPQEARQRAERGFELLRRRHALDVVGQRIRRLLTARGVL